MLSRLTASNGVVRYISPMLADIGVKHGFTTRIGGVSERPFESLNLGNPPGELRDSSENVAENIRRVETATDLCNARRMWIHQVHGNDVLVARDSSFENGSHADAIICDEPTNYLFIRVADCVPILLSTPDGKVVAAIHAGWRGVIAGVVLDALRAIAALTETPNGKLRAAIGPCISQEFFEVGPEVIAEFTRLFGSSARWADRHVNLPEAVAIQLQDGGVSNDLIDRTDRCTARDRDEFFSHRRDQGITGRMAAVIAPLSS